MARFHKRPNLGDVGRLVRVKFCESNHPHLRMTLIWKYVMHGQALTNLRRRCDIGRVRQCIVPSHGDTRIGVGILRIPPQIQLRLEREKSVGAQLP